MNILAAQHLALEPGNSRILIVDFVLPDTSLGLTETLVDLIMMTACDGERSRSGWRELLGKAGFKKIWWTGCTHYWTYRSGARLR